MFILASHFQIMFDAPSNISNFRITENAIEFDQTQRANQLQQSIDLHIIPSKPVEVTETTLEPNLSGRKDTADVGNVPVDISEQLTQVLIENQGEKRTSTEEICETPCKHRKVSISTILVSQVETPQPGETTRECEVPFLFQAAEFILPEHQIPRDSQIPIPEEQHIQKRLSKDIQSQNERITSVLEAAGLYQSPRSQHATREVSEIRLPSPKDDMRKTLPRDDTKRQSTQDNTMIMAQGDVIHPLLVDDRQIMAEDGNMRPPISSIDRPSSLKRRRESSIETPLGSLDRTKVSLGDSIRTTESIRFIKDEWGTHQTMLKIFNALKTGTHPLTVETLIEMTPDIPKKRLALARCFGSILKLKQFGMLTIEKDPKTLAIVDIKLGPKMFT